MIKYFIEIKNRLILVMFSLITFLIITYCYKEILLFLLIKPSLLKNVNVGIFYVIFTNINEIFSTYAKLIFFLTFQIFGFFLIFHFFNFLFRSFYKKEYLFCVKFLKICFITWICSLYLTDFFLISLTWDFFFYFKTSISYQFISIHFEPKIIEYLEFCIFLYSTCIFYSQFFAILLFIIFYFTNNSKFIKKFRKLYYYSFLIFSTLITPPDIFSQIFLGLSLIFSYELITFIFIFQKFLTIKIIKTN